MKRLSTVNQDIGKNQQLNSLNILKKLLRKDLFRIEPICKEVNRDILSLIYSPGVAQVCLQIVNNPKEADQLTLRGRSIAILSKGQILNCQNANFLPVMDWFVSQLKFYGGLDSFPFLVRPESDIQSVIKDLGTTYGTILYLDRQKIISVPEDVLFISHIEIVQNYGGELTDAFNTTKIISYLMQNKIKGILNIKQYQIAIHHTPQNFQNYTPYGKVIKDNKTLREKSLNLHRNYNGKIHVQLNFYDIKPLIPYFTQKNLRNLIKENNIYSKTSKLSCIVSDGTAILGLGNIGPVAGIPVMEGKSLLFKSLGDVEVVPICMHSRPNATQLTHDMAKMLSHFSAINLEDIKAPQCFEVEQGLKNFKMPPIFHDDQHGTAIVVLASFINAIKVSKKNSQYCKIIINGAGAAGITIAKLLVQYGCANIIICDTAGSIFRGRKNNMNPAKQKIAQLTNPKNQNDSLKQVLKQADVFIGVSKGKILIGEDIRSMKQDSIVFALANPTPQVSYSQCIQNGCLIYGSGRSDIHNQINNSLVFPGIFRGILQHNIKQITVQMKINAAKAIAESLISQPSPLYIIPDSLDKDVAIRISNSLI